jgi:hypothetical protein
MRRRGSHMYQTSGSQMALRLTDLGDGLCLPPMKIPDTHFC